MIKYSRLNPTYNRFRTTGNADILLFKYSDKTIRIIISLTLIKTEDKWIRGIFAAAEMSRWRPQIKSFSTNQMEEL